MTKKNKIKRGIIYISTLITYFALRFPLLTKMNEYVDYDEGTYLLFARYINHGILPYRDIFAVHPPLYYYLMALWIKIFGDNYISGRTLSLTLGMVSLIIAYKIGEELKDWKLGAILSGILVLDPIFIQVNSLAFHESLIELTTLGSIYYFIRYYKTNQKKNAYISVAIAALGSTAKFTIIPFLIALYVTIIFASSHDVKRYYTTATEIMLSTKQALVILVAYIIAITFTISIISLWPSEIARLIFIVPGLHDITKIGHVYGTIGFLFFWLLLVIFIFNVAYLKQTWNSTRIMLSNWKFGVLLAITILGVKSSIEIPLGLMISKNYIFQTYLAQGHRGVPFITGFKIMYGIIHHIQTDAPDVAIVWVVPMTLLWLLLLLRLKGKKFPKELGLEMLFLNSIVLYLIIFPMLAGPRYLLPLILLGYIVATYKLSSLKIDTKGLTAVFVSALVIIGMASYGMSQNYPTGKLKAVWAVHSKEMREDLQEYLKNMSKNEICLSMNPMNTYYLKLRSPAWITDTFGIVYLSGKDKNYLLNKALSLGVNCTILSTWMYLIRSKDPILNRAYTTFENYTITNGTLLFGESFNNGEILELFIFKRPQSPFRITTWKAALQINLGDQNTINIYALSSNDEKNKNIQIKYINGSYNVLWTGNSGNKHFAKVEYTSHGVNIRATNKFTLEIYFTGVALSQNNVPLSINQTVNTLKLCNQNECINLNSESIILRKKGILIVVGRDIKITLISGES